MTSLADLEREKYEKVWTFPKYRDWSPGESLVCDAVMSLNMKPGESVIDYGCGTGRALKLFQEMDIKVTGIDHAANCLETDVPFIQSCLWDLPDIESDYAFCTDVMEHIPEEKVSDVLNGIKERCRAAYFQICLTKDGFGPLILGEPLHLTVQPVEWWAQKMPWAKKTIHAKSTSAVFICE